MAHSGEPRLMLPKTKPLVDTPLILNLDTHTQPECVVGVLLFLYLQNTIRFVSENTENVFAVLLSVK